MRLQAKTDADAVAADGDRGAGASGWTVAWFVGLAFGFSWAWLLPLALTGRHVVAGEGWPTHVPAELGPLVAALVVTTWQEGRPQVLDLLARMGRWRVPLRWWLFAVSPLLLLVVVLVVDRALGTPSPPARDFAAFSGLPSAWGVAGVSLALVVMAFGEETGWRGFALPHLQQRHTPLGATMVVATMWVLWHAPAFLVVDSYRAFNAAITVGWAMGLFCGAVVLSWLYNRSGSILLVAVWHASYNLISGTDAATGLLAAASTTLVIALAVTLVVLEVRAGRGGRASVLGPRVRPTFR